MKALPFNIPKTQHASIQVQVDDGPHFYDRLHFHPEWQLTAVKKGRGVLFLGNSFTHFTEGALFVVGSNVPHLVKNDPIYFSEKSPGVHAVSLFFHEDSFGKGFFDLPELAEVQKLLMASSRGLFAQGEVCEEVHAKVMACVGLQGIDLFQQFLSILGALGNQPPIWGYLNEWQAQTAINEEDGQRLNKVFQFSFQNYDREIELSEAASMANLSVSQFCRYFKAHTRKTYMGFLNELRIEKACELLTKKDITISQVSYSVGFNNLSHFNRTFKKFKGLTPSAYKKAFSS